MSVQLHKRAVEKAEKEIQSSEFETYNTNWEAEKPTPDEVNYFIKTHYLEEYGLWFLGIDTSVPKNIKEHYVYPHGDLKLVNRSALVDTIQKAEKAGHQEIVDVAKRLLDMVDKKAKS